MPSPSIYSKFPYGYTVHPSTHITLVLPIVFCFLLVLIWSYRQHTSTRHRLPPSPVGHWFWGNVSLMNRSYRHVILGTQYKQELGDIISLVNPRQTTIVVNTFELANELLDKNSGATSDRPHNVMTKELLGWSNSVGFHIHNERHKKLRRVLASALHPSAARSYASQHLGSTHDLLRRVVLDPNNFRESIKNVIAAFILRLGYGYIAKPNDPLIDMVHLAVEYLVISQARYFLVNDFPILKHLPAWFPGAGFKRFAQEGGTLRYRYVNEPFEAVFNQIRCGRVESLSFTSRLLESKGGANASQSDIDLVKWSSGSMFTGGSSTTVGLVLSCFLLMSLHPDVAHAAQAEIDTIVGRDRIPELKDRDSLPYMDAVLQEIMRMCPLAPLGVAHRSTMELELAGYCIPKGANIEPNIWAMSRDPNHYSSPHKFDPTRFLKATPELDPRKYIFGFGRRVCPGIHLANNSVWVMCAGIIATLDIRPSPELLAKVESIGGRESERFYELFSPTGAANPLPFSCTITPRDAAAASLIDNSAE